MADTKHSNSDYTEWRRDNLFEGMTLEELVSCATEYEQQYPDSVPKNAQII